MKKLVLLLVVCLLFGLKGYSQFYFGVAPGLSTNTANFGFKAGKVVPYVGFQYANVSFTNEYFEHDWNGTDYDDYDSEMKISGNLLIPEIGVKFFAIEKNNLKAYLNLNLTKPMIRGKLESNGTENEEFSDLLKEIKLFGGEFGFGCEYFFDDNFSIGGEFGIRYLRGKFNNKDEYDDGHDSYEENDIKVGLAPTYSKISLNFYFGGKGGE